MDDNSPYLQLEHVFQNFPVSISWMDRNHVFQGCNLEAMRLVGVKSSQEFIGRTILDFAKMNDWPPTKAQEIYDQDERIMKTGIPEAQIEDIMPQGAKAAPIYQAGAKKPIFDQNGQVIGLIAVGLYTGEVGSRYTIP